MKPHFNMYKGILLENEIVRTHKNRWMVCLQIIDPVGVIDGFHREYKSKSVATRIRNRELAKYKAHCARTYGATEASDAFLQAKVEKAYGYYLKHYRDARDAYMPIN
jgi:hypothetical protein